MRIRGEGRTFSIRARAARWEAACQSDSSGCRLEASHPACRLCTAKAFRKITAHRVECTAPTGTLSRHGPVACAAA